MNLTDQIKYYTEKADDLLKLGDSLAFTKPAESRRILRECLRYRRKVKLLKIKLYAKISGK